jgi:DNA-binding MarR family transcriptional regulator
MPESPQSTARLVLDTLPALMQAVQAEIRKVAHPLPPMPHYRALKLLQHSGPLALGDLATHCKVSMPTMSHTVTVMANNGLVERIADPDDRRKVEVTLTDTGIATLTRMEQHMVELLAGFFSDLSADDLASLTRGFEVLRQVSEAQRSEGDSLAGDAAVSPA